VQDPARWEHVHLIRGLAGKEKIVRGAGCFMELKIPYGNIIATFSVGLIRHSTAGIVKFNIVTFESIW
jgi:hypothetical protein